MGLETGRPTAQRAKEVKRRFAPKKMGVPIEAFFLVLEKLDKSRLVMAGNLLAWCGKGITWVRPDVSTITSLPSGGVH